MGRGQSRVSSKVPLILSLAALAGAASLCTPYPERLFRYLVSKPQPKTRTVVRYVEKPAKPVESHEIPDKPDVESHAVLDLEAWTPQTSFGMPIIQLPAFPPALPERVNAGQYDHINKMGTGISIASSVHFAEGTTAAQDRKRDDAYQLKVSLNLRLPQAGTGEHLLKINPSLPRVLNAYQDLMDNAQVSPWYHSLMLHKQNRVRKNAATLSQVLDRHNFYDTETILEIKAPATGRKLLWIQADMDVVSDGSDGDRLSIMPRSICESSFYQPTTSYRWEKRGKTPNPLLPYWEKRLMKLKKDKASAASIDYAQRTIVDLKRYSFLLADYDPFIVLSLTMRESSSAYEAQLGDYVVVIVGKKAYPAIVGDYGPRYKSGEASLRLCRAINPRANTYSRPISDLGVSYLVFPKSGDEKKGPIDYDQLYRRCYELLDEIGGLGEGIKLQKMKNLLPEKLP